MKTTFFILLLTFLFSFSPQSFSKANNIPIKAISAIYEVYSEINGELWRFVYNDDGSLIFKERIFE